ncbi:hypothetical protein M8818_001541 [Zalaria obscura]|uniref:Uncharacterized protein n=1 Tax=Zalaria obscura TaxID=2024903 RepID=A0ACC3SKK1_9PEZI
MNIYGSRVRPKCRAISSHLLDALFCSSPSIKSNFSISCVFFSHLSTSPWSDWLARLAGTLSLPIRPRDMDMAWNLEGIHEQGYLRFATLIGRLFGPTYPQAPDTEDRRTGTHMYICERAGVREVQWQFDRTRHHHGTNTMPYQAGFSKTTLGCHPLAAVHPIYDCVLIDAALSEPREEMTPNAPHRCLPIAARKSSPPYRVAPKIPRLTR